MVLTNWADRLAVVWHSQRGLKEEWGEACWRTDEEEKIQTHFVDIMHQQATAYNHIFFTDLLWNRFCTYKGTFVHINWYTLHILCGLHEGLSCTCKKQKYIQIYNTKYWKCCTFLNSLPGFKLKILYCFGNFKRKFEIISAGAQGWGFLHLLECFTHSFSQDLSPREGGGDVDVSPRYWFVMVGSSSLKTNNQSHVMDLPSTY